MKDSKLIAAIQSLSPKELKKFEKYLASPYFNEHSGILKLAELLFQQYPEFDEEQISKKQVYEVLFHGAPYDDLKLRHLVSDFLKLLESFLAQLDYEEDQISSEFFCLQSLRHRGLDKHFNSVVKKAKNKLKKTNEIGLNYYYSLHQVESEINASIGEHYVRKGDNNVQKAADYLDKYFIVRKLRYGCMKLNYESVFESEYQLFLFEEILNHVEQQGYSDDKLISCYYFLYKGLSDLSNQTYYQSFKAVVEHITPRIDSVLGREIYALATNYCIKQINMGKIDYNDETMYFYEHGLNRDFLLSSRGDMSPFDFKNMVVISCNLKKYKWAESLIRDYGNFLPADQRENSITLNTALVYWFKQDYTKVLRLLSKVEFDDPFYALDAKTILLKIYLESGEHDLLLSLCESFRIYLKRNKLVSEQRKKPRLHLIKYVSRLIKIKPHQKERLLNIKNEINNQKAINNRAWLLEQISIMEEKMESY